MVIPMPSRCMHGFHQDDNARAFGMFPTKRRLNHCIEGGRGSSQFRNLCFEQLFCLNMCHLSLLANLDWMGLLFLVDNDTSPLFGYQDFKRSVVEEWSLGSFLVTLHRNLWAFSHIILGQVHKPGAVVRLTVQLNGMPYICSIAQLHLGYVFFQSGMAGFAPGWPSKLQRQQSHPKSPRKRNA